MVVELVDLTCGLFAATEFFTRGDPFYLHPSPLSVFGVLHGRTSIRLPLAVIPNHSTRRYGGDHRSFPTDLHPELRGRDGGEKGRAGSPYDIQLGFQL